MFINWKLKEVCDREGFSVKRLFAPAEHKVGSTYWCGYWQSYYTVTGKDGRWVDIVWEDGRTSRHCTELDAMRDCELVKLEVATCQTTIAHSGGKQSS